MNDKDPIKIIILDIEGTTTPIEFVTNTLFSYIRKELNNYLIKNWNNKETQEDIQLLREELLKEFEKDKNIELIPLPNKNTIEEQKLIQECVIKNVLKQMDEDKKSTSLKQLQGHIWRNAFESGEIKGIIYSDVIIALKKWKEKNIFIYIYSSGSIEAQKLIFKYSNEGNLLEYLSGHFDTTSGSKIEFLSYQNIFNILKKQNNIENLKINNILFITDNINEANAAYYTGMKVCLANRPGNKSLPEKHSYIVINNFLELFNHFHFN